MERKQAFEQVMGESVNMALATSVDDQPNVRVVSFGYDKAHEGKLYFCTFRGNQKIKEFTRNPKVACVPLPLGPEAEAQVRVFGRVQESQLPLEELIKMIGKKAQGDADTMMEAGDMLQVYEICFDEAWVTVGMTDAQRYVVGE